MGIDPNWPTYRIERRFTADGHVYERGDLIDVATLMSWRNGEKLTDIYYVVKAPRHSRAALTAQRRDAGRKSRESVRDFKALVRRICLEHFKKPVAAKHVREALLTPRILKHFTQRPTPLSIVDVHEAPQEGGLPELVYVTKDGAPHAIARSTLSTYVSEITKSSRGSSAH